MSDDGFVQLTTQEARGLLKDGDPIEVELVTGETEPGTVRYKGGTPMFQTSKRTPIGVIGVELNFGRHRVRRITKERYWELCGR